MRTAATTAGADRNGVQHPELRPTGGRADRSTDLSALNGKGRPVVSQAATPNFILKMKTLPILRAVQKMQLEKPTRRL
jgi:hypothetical protein